MARIDALLQHMVGNGANRAVLSADAPSILETGEGAKQGKPMAGAQIEAMLDEIMPAQARQNLQNGGRAEFSYAAPAGDFQLVATQPNGQWHLEIMPATNASDATAADVAASQTAPESVVIAPTQGAIASAPEVELTKKPGPPRFDPSASSAPPPSPPDAAAPPGGYAPVGYPPAGYAPGANDAYNNDSGRGDASVLPAELQGFNWGALFGSWIWGLGNSVWIALLCLVPCIGFFMRFFLGAKGNEMAWKSKRWESVQAFRSTQKTWAIVGGVFSLMSLVVVIPIMAAILFPVFARARENARRAECQSNLKQISLGILQYTQDYDEHYPTGTTMAEWKPKLMPYLNGNEQIFVCPTHTGANESYEINPALSGLELGKINSPSQTPMIYEPDSALHLDGSNMAFADGHVKWFREQTAPKLTPK